MQGDGEAHSSEAQLNSSSEDPHGNFSPVGAEDFLEGSLSGGVNLHNTAPFKFQCACVRSDARFMFFGLISWCLSCGGWVVGRVEDCAAISFSFVMPTETLPIV